ncbi:MAG: outer membrane beta-barrel protein [Bacteroidales bacterium]|nr:outer membrane beta-barrel protein [Bacteroidales bacterium]
MSNRNHIIFLLLFFSVAHIVSAQRINAYVSAGAAFSQIEGDELKGFNKLGFAGSVGAMANLSGNGRWQMSVEAGYARRGAFNNSGDPYNVKIMLDYVDIPLTVFFKDPYGGLLVGIGPVYSRLVQQPHDKISFSPEYFIPDTADMTFLKNDLALAGEIRFAIWRGLHMSIRYQYSIIPVKKNWHFEENPNTTSYRKWGNNCYNISAMVRILWQFGATGDGSVSKSKR